MLTNGEYQRLKDDIAKHGLIQPIVLHEGKVLDGRNRYRACRELGVQPRFVNYDGQQSPVEYAWSINAARRHQTPSQLAAVAAEMLPMLEEEARKRQEAALLAHGRGREKGSASCEADPFEHNDEAYGKSAQKAAEITGSSRSSVGRAAYVKKHDPAMFARIKSGEITANAAYDAVKASAEPKLPKQQPREKRAADIRALAETGHTARQIADKLGTGLSNVKKIAHEEGITLPDAHIGKVRQHDSRRIIEATVHGLEGYALGLSVIGPEINITSEEAAAWVVSLDQSLSRIRKLRKLLVEVSHGDE